MNETRALELLRDADPARDAEVRWAKPPSVADVPRSSRRVLLAVAAVVVLIAAVAASLTFVLRNRDDDGPSVATTSLPPGYIRPGQPDPHKVETEAAAARVFAAIPVLPGSTRRSSAPDPALRQLAATSVVGKNTTDRVAWWIWSGTHEQAVREFQQRMPKDFPRQPGSGPLDGVRVFPFEREATDATAQLVVSLSVLDRPHGVAMRVDVQANWRPSRTTDSFIASVRSVQVRYEVEHFRPPRAPTVASRTFRGTTAGDLAIGMNASVTSAVFAASCGPVQPDRARTTLTFHTDAGTFTATDGCFDVRLATPTKTYYPLAIYDIDDRARMLLGLPDDFGMR